MEAKQEEAELTCVECGATSSGDETMCWRAYLADTTEIATYCLACAAREFDEYL
jgi:hypothetical protein